MVEISIKDKKSCNYDLVSLGEVMLRFDPGDQRIRSARTFQVWEGGGEYNVARGLSQCFNQSTAIVTGLVDNEVGKLLLSLIQAGGVDSALIKWAADDGIGATARNGIYFLEKGFGIRSAKGASDRAHTAASQLRPGDIDWDALFIDQGVRWFHTGGVFAGLSPTTPLVIKEAIKAARKNGTIVSYDLNYRPSLWQGRGGKIAADQVNQSILGEVDVLFGIESLSYSPRNLDVAPFKIAIQDMVERFPNLKAVASTMRIVKSANINDWSGLLWMGNQFYETTQYANLEIFDRVGGGDAFAAGLIYGLCEGLSPEKSLQYAVVHGALTMTTPGDNSNATLDEVEHVINHATARVIR